MERGSHGPGTDVRAEGSGAESAQQGSRERSRPVQDELVPGGARKREHRDAAPGARRTETEVRLEGLEASASAAASVEQALRAELELARKEAELARKDAELARKDAALKDAESELLQAKLARKDAELARKEAEHLASRAQLSLERNGRGRTEVVANNIQDLINSTLSDKPKLSLDPFQNISSSFNPVENLVLPKKPTEDEPYLLFHGLDACAEPSTEVYEYLVNMGPRTPCAICGVSGIGKTRNIFEYLCHNYGMYFVAGASGRKYADRAPGSQDFRWAMNHLDNQWTAPGAQGDHGAVRNVLLALVYTRWLIFDGLHSRLGRKPKPYEWLLVQVHPGLMCSSMEQDPFLDLVKWLVDNVDKQEMDRLFHANLERRTAFRVFVDEAQHLLRVSQNKFLSETSDKLIRSMYSAVIRGFNAAVESSWDRSKGLLYPVMTGTGLSFDSFMPALTGIAGKDTIMAPPKGYRIAFETLPAFGEADVKAYMARFADLSLESDKHVRHACKWLCGRPRWTATFLTRWLQDSQRKLASSEVKCPELLKQLRNFIAFMTQKPPGDPPGTLSPEYDSAYEMLRKFWVGAKERDAQSPDLKVKAIQSATLEYALSGNPAIVSDSEQRKLVECGLCIGQGSGQGSGEGSSKGNSELQVYLREPLIVEAALHYFGLEGYLMGELASTAGSPSAAGHKFELIVVSELREKIQGILNKQIGPIAHENYSDFDFGLSAYGVLARKCNGSGETIAWMRESIAATMNGSIPPFCLPDDRCGPDLIAFLRKRGDFEDFVPFLAQMKFQKTVSSQPEALRTTEPTLLFHDKRAHSPSLCLEQPMKESWQDTFQKMFGTGKRKLRSIRGLVQYPAKKTARATPGAILTSDLVDGVPPKQRSGTEPPTGEDLMKEHDFFITTDAEKSEAIVHKPTN